MLQRRPQVPTYGDAAASAGGMNPMLVFAIVGAVAFVAYRAGEAKGRQPSLTAGGVVGTLAGLAGSYVAKRAMNHTVETLMSGAKR